MGKNFIKVLVSGFGIGIVLTKIYDWGRADGVHELHEAIIDTLEKGNEEAEQTE